MSTCFLCHYTSTGTHRLFSFLSKCLFSIYRNLNMMSHEDFYTQWLSDCRSSCNRWTIYNQDKGSVREPQSNVIRCPLVSQDVVTGWWTSSLCLWIEPSSYLQEQTEINLSIEGGGTAPPSDLCDTLMGPVKYRTEALINAPSRRKV